MSGLCLRRDSVTSAIALRIAAFFHNSLSALRKARSFRISRTFVMADFSSRSSEIASPSTMSRCLSLSLLCITFVHHPLKEVLRMTVYRFSGRHSFYYLTTVFPLLSQSFTTDIARPHVHSVPEAHTVKVSGTGRLLTTSVSPFA